MTTAKYSEEAIEEARANWLEKLENPNRVDYLASLEALMAMLQNSKEVKSVAFKKYQKVEGLNNTPTISRRSKRRSRRK